MVALLDRGIRDSQSTVECEKPVLKPGHTAFRDYRGVEQMAAHQAHNLKFLVQLRAPQPFFRRYEPNSADPAVPGVINAANFYQE